MGSTCEEENFAFIEAIFEVLVSRHPVEEIPCDQSVVALGNPVSASFVKQLPSATVKHSPDRLHQDFDAKLQGVAANSTTWCTSVGNARGEVLSSLTTSECLSNLKRVAIT